MDEEALRDLLDRFASGSLGSEEVIRELRFMPYADLGFAKVDHHRELRVGFPEAVFGMGKTPEQVGAITKELARSSTSPLLVTKASPEQYSAVRDLFPEAEYHPASGLIVVRPSETSPSGTVAVVCAGTSDLPVAEEALLTAGAAGLKAELIADVGVAGLHRLFGAYDVMAAADVVIAVAGMEGALPSLLAGLLPGPVIAVPTSVGYGVGAGGAAAMMAMLSSCAPGIATVNIDNGFGAAIVAAAIARRIRP